MRKVVVAVAIVVLVAPASALASPEPTGQDRVNAARACKALRGDADFPFAATYRTFGACVSAWARPQHESRHNAARACRAERAEVDASAFRAKYGTNENKRNAFGRCVSGKRRAATRAELTNEKSAAHACKAQRAELGVTAFRDEYGTNRTKRNAFGKCVSSRAQAADTSAGVGETQPSAS